MDFKKYENKIPYPEESSFTKFFGYKNGVMVYEGEYRPTVNDDCGAWEKVFDQEGYDEARNVYGAEAARLEELFKQDLFEDFSISDNPKREKLYSIAYDKGHSYGYSEIYNVACDLVELIKED